MGFDVFRIDLSISNGITRKQVLQQRDVGACTGSFIDDCIKQYGLEDIEKIFVNQGPGKFSGIRASLAIAKALSFANKIDLYGFSSDQIIDQNYVEIIELFNKGLLNKNLIKPQY
mgnify:CR=1 FL=1